MIVKTVLPYLFSYYKLINNRVYGLYTWLNYKKLLI